MDADALGLQVLHELSTTMADAGTQLVVLHAPDESGGRP